MKIVLLLAITSFYLVQSERNPKPPQEGKILSGVLLFLVLYENLNFHLEYFIIRSSDTIYRT